MLFIGEGASVLSFYTETEKLQSFETGYKLPEAILKERMDTSMEAYLESDLHLRLVQERIDKVILQFPEYSFDTKYMNVFANSYAEVRDKFESLREANLNVEQELIASGKYFAPEKAINIHLTRLITFQYAYINALSAGKRTVELDLTLNKLPEVLNEELGNLVDITDLPRLFTEGIGKSVGVITATGTNLIKDVFSGVSQGIAEGLGFDKDLLVKIGIGASVGIALIIVGLVAYQYSKSYVSEKGAVKARS